MIAFQEAYKTVLEHTIDLPLVEVPLEKAVGRVLAEPIYADRDFPPFDRVTKDGIAIDFASFEKGNRAFQIQEVAAAGDAEKTLKDPNDCIEVMTGAMLPKGTDTVIMYEQLEVENGIAKIGIAPKKGQDIHQKGSDEQRGNLLLEPNKDITAAEIGVLATVGKATVLVKKLPKVAIVSTGNELVNIDEIPAPHQIRKSNSFVLQAALKKQGIKSELLHFNDDRSELLEGLKTALEANDVLLLSGGVSRGKFDYLPEVLGELGVKKLFHKVKQRPGKPFWFGKSKNCTLFAFPGNPASTFANYHTYFLPWLAKSLGLSEPENHVFLNEPYENHLDLTRFVLVDAQLCNGTIKATLVKDNGSGDLTSLTKGNGFALFEPKKHYKVGGMVPFFPTKKVW